MIDQSISNIGWVIFGPSSDLFATWTVSFVTMTRVALGEFDNIYPLMIEINYDAALIIIITYQVKIEKTLPCFFLAGLALVCSRQSDMLTE